MANITEIALRNGEIRYRVRFRVNGECKSVFLDSSYKRKEVEHIKTIIENVVYAMRHEEMVDRATRVFLDSAPYELKCKFAEVGFVEAKKQSVLNDVWKAFLKEKLPTVAPSTQLIFGIIEKRLFSLFQKKRPICSITEQEALESRNKLILRYSEATVSKTIERFRTFFNWALINGYVETNVYANVKKGSTVNHSKDFRVPTDWTERILDACPTQCWRALFVLWRYGGLRQQEPLELKWSHVDWANKTLLVTSPKTRRYEGKANRVIPLVPIIERELKKLRKESPEDESYIIWQNRRKGFDSGFRKILFSAGLEPWPKLFQNMRSSRENDLIEAGYPAHIVGQWQGHTRKVQEQHYLQMSDVYFNRVLTEGT